MKEEKPTNIERKAFSANWALPGVDEEEITMALRGMKAYSGLVQTNPAVIPSVFDACQNFYIIVSPFLNIYNNEKAAKMFAEFLVLSKKEYTNYKIRRMNGLPFRLSTDYIEYLLKVRIRLQMYKRLSGMGILTKEVDTRSNKSKFNSYLLGD